MLPHYSALKVAEQFRVLEAIAPGRIDLGLGRAPGGDGLTAHALNPNAAVAAGHFPAQVRDLLAWLAGEALADATRSATSWPCPPVRPCPRCGCSAVPTMARRSPRISACPIASPISSPTGRGRRGDGALSRPTARATATPTPAGRLRLGARGGNAGQGGAPVLQPRAGAAEARPRRSIRAALARGSRRLSYSDAERARLEQLRQRALIGTRQGLPRGCARWPNRGRAGNGGAYRDARPRAAPAQLRLLAASSA